MSDGGGEKGLNWDRGVCFMIGVGLGRGYDKGVYLKRKGACVQLSQLGNIVMGTETTKTGKRLV